MKIYVVKPSNPDTNQFYKKLIANLSVFTDNPIVLWTESDLIGGDNITAKKAKHLTEADMILFLVSSEIFGILDEYKNKPHKKAIVVISTCVWTYSDLLNHCKLLHTANTTYTSATNKDSFVLDCVTNLMIMNE